jgi:hypothetical protein
MASSTMSFRLPCTASLRTSSDVALIVASSGCRARVRFRSWGTGPCQRRYGATAPGCFTHRG